MFSLQRVVLLFILVLVSVPALAGAQSQVPEPARGRLVEVILTLDAPPLARGGQMRTLSAAQGNVEAGLARSVPDLTVQRRFSTVLDGLAVRLPQGQLDRLQGVDGVTKVYPNVGYRSLRSTTPSFIGAPALWGPKLSSAGQSVKIGIIDDGLDRTHPYFKARGYRMPRGYPKGNKRFTDAKVIVARAFAPRSPKWKYASRPFDPLNSEHATHVAGIAAGNYRTPARGSRISGVAPKAYIGNYKVLTIPDDGFGLNGNSAEIVAGIEAAVRDGMDVINLSLGEAEIDPSRDIVARALDGAAAAGVVPVVAAGNDYEDLGAGSVTSPGSSASAITAAAENQNGPFIASFSSGGPTPLSLRMKPDVTAPGEDVLSSVPRRAGLWARFSGTSMAAPHVAGAAALLRQRHRGWTVEQIKSALVQTGKPVVGAGGAEVDTTREGGGTIDLVRADRPLLFSSPTSLSFGFVRPGAQSSRQVALSDAGGGTGDWSVSTTLQQPAAGATVAVLLPTTTVPGPLVVTATATPGAAEATHSGFVVLQRGSDRRRIPFWFRVAAPKLGQAQTTPLTQTGTYHGDTRGRSALVTAYRYPEDARMLGVSRTLLGPEQVFRVSLSRPVANFGVAVTAGRRNIEPRVVRAGDENQLLGEIGLPFNANPYLPPYGTPLPVAGAVLPAPGDYDVVFDSGTVAGAGAFTFRFWIGDTTPPRLKLVSTRGGRLRVGAVDNGAGIDPQFVRLSVDGHARSARYDASRNEITASLKGLRRGRHTLTLLVSDYQEPKNMENVPKILPNTSRLRASFRVR
jgi:subtilisin family serine protease